MTDRRSDLQIIISQSDVLGRTELSFKLRALDQSLGLNFKNFGPILLQADPEAYARTWDLDVDSLPLGTDEEKAIAEHRIAGKGATLFKDLVPGGLQEVLWDLQSKVSTIQILSDEPYIPWELVKLRRRVKGRWKDGPFLCEAFSVTRWLCGIPEVFDLPLTDIALVVPKSSLLPYAEQERAEMLRLADTVRKVTDIEARFSSVTEALASARHDAWHFSGHGIDNGVDANRSAICLDEESTLRPEDLNVSVSNLGLTKPLFFFNGCHTGHSGFSLGSVGGWSKQLLDLGVGAFIGTHWAIEDQAAKEFARSFYKHFLGGYPIGDAVRRARLDIHAGFPGEPTWLAYTVFAHPLAMCRPGTAVHSPKQEPVPLSIPGSQERSELRGGLTPVVLLPLDHALADDQLVPGKPAVEPLTQMRLVSIPGGRFQMGGTAFPSEMPIHWVRVSPFWLGETPVTNAQYALFMKNTGAAEPEHWRDRRFSSAEQPVVGVSWEDVQVFCKWLGETWGQRVLLPTEAQWEFAARGPEGREYPWGNEPPDATRACFGLDPQKGQPAPVGSYPAGRGPFGTLDQAGSIWEWCHDAWDERTYAKRTAYNGEPLDPFVGGDEGSRRVLRGGAWDDSAVHLRAAFRFGFSAWYRNFGIGFRVACVPAKVDP